MKAVATLAWVVLVLAVGGCGGQGEGGSSSLPSVTRSVPHSAAASVTRSPERPSATRSPERPSATRSPERPSATGSKGDAAGPSSAPAQPSRTAITTTTATATAVTTVTSTPGTTTPEPTSSASPQAAAGATDDEDGTGDDWVWWAVGLLLVLAAVTGTLLLRRRRARAEWSAGLRDALAEVTWLSHDLVPGLLAQDGAGRSGVWAIGRTRVLRLEQTLESLLGRAPDDVTARHCSTLAASVQTVRQVLDQAEIVGNVGGDATTTALRQAKLGLDDAAVAASAPRRPRSPPDGPAPASV